MMYASIGSMHIPAPIHGNNARVMPSYEHFKKACSTGVKVPDMPFLVKWMNECINSMAEHDPVHQQYG